SIASTVGTRRNSGTLSLSESKEEVQVIPAWDSLSGITLERVRSINQDNPRPALGYSFSEGQTRANSTASNRTGGGRYAQVVSSIRKPFGDGLNQALSKNSPVVDDLPRPGLTPF
ncbi:unnamed protein product, partial [Ascophyllum nodosum]